MKSFRKLKIKHKYLFFAYAIFILLLVLAYFIVVDTKIRKYIEDNRIALPPFKYSITEYPILTTDEDLYISALAAVALDDDSKTLLFSKNVNLLFSMASTAKIMTALVAMQHFKMDDVLTIFSDNIEGVTLGFETGQKVQFEDLLYAMLLPSANDAAQAIADNYPGGEAGFVKQMNKVAKSLHLDNTHFADPIGLLDDRDYTTPLDLARLASFALKNKIFSKVVATKEKVITDVDKQISIPIYNLNRLLGVDGVNGVKTGYTDGAGQVLVTSREQNGRTIISVVMASGDRFLDTQNLLRLISDNITYLSIHP
jgi:serine-type D-Ala-D-Ala carboxypeptidase (penicillin-binding protein 5/6)